MSEAESRWEEYYRATLDKPAHPHLENLEPHLPPAGLAYDLGSGAGRGTRWLVEHGLDVIAVDNDPKAMEFFHQNPPKIGNVKTIATSFTDLQLEPCVLVMAQFSLFFMPRPELEAFWKKLWSAIKPGGLFSGQLLGVNDEWAPKGYTVLTRAEVDEWLLGTEVIHLEEVERDGETALKVPKHWHIFHIVARKPHLL